MRNFTLAASVMLLTAAGLAAQSYSLDKVPPPMSANDAFELELPHAVMVGKHVLPPGTYRFEPLEIAGSELPVLSIRAKGDERKTVNIAAMVEPAFKEIAPPETKATYYHIGDNYYFNRIFVRGLNYGFRFELPKGVKAQPAQ